MRLAAVPLGLGVAAIQGETTGKPAPKTAAPAGAASASAPAEAPSAGAEAQQKMYVREYRVLGSKSLPRLEVEEAVYPFLGPGRTFDDLEKARTALEKVYHDKGFKATQVVIPEQTFARGVVLLQTYEGKVGKLYVKGARYFLPSRVRAQARSLAEGKIINFNDVTRDIIALNQLADRRVEPKLTPSGEPGVFNIDLNVKDSRPLHGSIEFNNRQSPNTTESRINASISYGNLWQRGHTIGASYQISPEDTSEVKVFTGYYIWRFEELDWLSLMFSGTKQDSNVSTLGAVAVAGRGEIFGVRGIITLPSMEGFFQSLSIGIDYKNFDQNVVIGGIEDVTPISYYPFSLTWDGTWLHSKQIDDPDKPGEKKRIELGTTELTAAVTMGFRGLGSDAASLERNRFAADANFIYFRGDLSHEQELGGGWQLYGKIQGQAADQPLVNSEQFGGGGMGTARGYLEAEALGDNGVFGTLELRTPSLLRTKRLTGTAPNLVEESTGDEWRLYAFLDAGTITLHDVLPEQDSSFRLASIGLGSELTFRKHFHSIVELALPLTSLTSTRAHEARVNFRIWAEF
jgi:hemolysin activation/secretion protein